MVKKKGFKILGLVVAAGIMLSGCGNSDSDSDSVESTLERNNLSASQIEEEDNTESEPENVTENTTENDLSQASTELEVRFGAGGGAFTLHLYDNDTAAAIAKHVGTSDWQLPIYHYDDFDDWEVMQYYDIPSRYEIPSAPEQITEEKAGTVYYSEPNRIILFYQDANVSGEYTPVGYFDYTDEFLQAVQNNPVLEGWGNKLVFISDGE